MGLPMKGYEIGGQVFDVIDETARKDSKAAQDAVNSMQSQVQSMQTTVNNCKSDVEKVKQASITPDKTLGITGAAADSKAVGDAINNAKSTLTSTINSTVDSAKAELDAKIKAISTESIEAVNKNKIANNLTTSQAGYVLDARQAAVLVQMIKKAEEMKISGAAEGSICSIDANGNVVASSMTIAKMGTGATYNLSGSILYVNTL